MGRFYTLSEPQPPYPTHFGDILDESDEILQVKYQLVYAIGSQERLDGGDLRWKICEGILQRLPEHFVTLLTKHGDAAIEFKSNAANPATFPHCRLIKPKNPDLIDLLAEDFLKSKIIPVLSLNSEEQALVKKFLTDNSTSEEEVERVREIFNSNNEPSRNWEILLIVVGYLKFGILESALGKRHRVNYGVNVKNPRRLMAVPFQAKDVASERTEFGHPDMAIIFTHLSYYHSGLSDEQILECFDKLKSGKLNPSTEYEKWISSIPKSLLHESVHAYGGINLDDYEQKTQLFPTLRMSMAIIDFWLSHFVFSRECKTFPGKMTATAWDLCSENKKLLTTGFSGTNDTQQLLPLNIQQADLPELETTNVELEGVLLDPVNDFYIHLQSDCSAANVLEKLVAGNIRVLLDCGALMLELNNEQVAEEWLRIDSTLEAIAYFNHRNVLTVRDRSGQDSDYELSYYRERLDKCGVYLDDEHTRGTDLKFPSGSKACVTIGSGLTRDKVN